MQALLVGGTHHGEFYEVEYVADRLFLELPDKSDGHITLGESYERLTTHSGYLLYEYIKDTYFL